MEKFNFYDIVNIIFENKQKYKQITDKDKVDSFYMINKKFSLYKENKDIDLISKKYNNKYIDRASVIDMWFIFFRKHGKIPYWYWSKSPFEKDKTVKKISQGDKKLLMEKFNLSENDYEFLYINFIDDLEHELKKIKRFE